MVGGLQGAEEARQRTWPFEFLLPIEEDFQPARLKHSYI